MTDRRCVLAIYGVAFTAPLLYRGAAYAAQRLGFGETTEIACSYGAYGAVGLAVWWLAIHRTWAPTITSISPPHRRGLPPSICDPLIVIVAVAATILTSVLIGPFGKDAEVLSDSAGVAYRVILRGGGMLVVPLAEEVAGRWLLYRGLRPARANGQPPLKRARTVLPAALVSSAAYGLIHYLVASPSRMATTAIAGLILAASYELSGKLWVPIAVHVFINALSNLTAEFGDDVGRPIGSAMVMALALPMFASLLRTRPALVRRD